MLGWLNGIGTNTHNNHGHLTASLTHTRFYVPRPPNVHAHKICAYDSHGKRINQSNQKRRKKPTVTVKRVNFRLLHAARGVGYVYIENQHRRASDWVREGEKKHQEHEKKKYFGLGEHKWQPTAVSSHSHRPAQKQMISDKFWVCCGFFDKLFLFFFFAGHENGGGGDDDIDRPTQSKHTHTPPFLPNHSHVSIHVCFGKSDFVSALITQSERTHAQPHEWIIIQYKKETQFVNRASKKKAILFVHKEAIHWNGNWRT